MKARAGHSERGSARALPSRKIGFGIPGEYTTWIAVSDGAQAIEGLPSAIEEALQDRKRFLGSHTLLAQLTQVPNDFRLAGRID